MEYTFEAELWLYPGLAAWHFITLPKEESTQIKAISGSRRGWGAVKVNVTIGASTWKTSIFPDKKRDAYLLPVKSEVRLKEKIAVGDKIMVSIYLL